MATPISYWIAFHVALVVLLAGEYLMARRVRDTHRKALYATILWVVASLVLAALVRPRFGTQGSIQYLAAYAIEESLSIDNLFMFLLLFRIFRIPEKRQPKVLFWGVDRGRCHAGLRLSQPALACWITFTGSAMSSAGCC